MKDRETSDTPSGGVAAIQLVLAILEELAKHDTVGVTELANRLGTTKPRVFRHLRTLLDQNYAVQNTGSDRYAAGPRLVALWRAAALTPDSALVQLARPTLLRLRDSLGYAVNLSLVYGDSVSIVETLPGRAIIDVVMRTHAGMPLHSTAAGKLLLAEHLDKDSTLLDGPFEQFTINTISDPDALRIELERVRSQGWAGAPEETVLGINAISAPVRDHDDTLVAMVSLMGSIQFIARQPGRTLVEGVRAAADEISRHLRL